MDKQLFLKVADAIEAHPELYTQKYEGYNSLNTLDKGCPRCVLEFMRIVKGDKKRLSIMGGIGLLGKRAEGLYCPCWPIHWLAKAELPTGGVALSFSGSTFFRPNAKQASTILRAMVKSGSIWSSKKQKRDSKGRFIGRIE